MKQFLIGLSVSGAFILGCVTASVAQSTAHAEPPPGVQRWEYDCRGAGKSVKDEIKDLGAAGWEMVSGAELMCFKRPLP